MEIFRAGSLYDNLISLSTVISRQLERRDLFVIRETMAN